MEEKWVKKLDRLSERKTVLVEKANKINSEIKIIEDEIKNVENERAAYLMKDFSVVLNEKGLDLNKVMECIKSGKLEYIEEHLNKNKK